MWFSCTLLNYNPYESELHNLPVDMGENIFLDLVPDWIKEKQGIQFLSFNDISDIKEAKYSFVSRYEANSLGEADNNWHGDNTRSIQETVNEKFVLLSFSFWLVKPSLLSCNSFFHFSEEGNPESRRQFGKLDQLYTSPDENDQIILDKHIKFTSQIFQKIWHLDRKGDLWLAIRMLIVAIREQMWETRYLILWVVVEAIFGSSNPQEATYRLSQRVALFLGNNANEKKELFKGLKKAYGLRSKSVHGMRLAKLTNEESLIQMKFTEEVIRDGLLKILQSNDLIEIFNSPKRDEYLEEIAFG